MSCQPHRVGVNVLSPNRVGVNVLSPHRVDVNVLSTHRVIPGHRAIFVLQSRGRNSVAGKIAPLKFLPPHFRKSSTVVILYSI